MTAKSEYIYLEKNGGLIGRDLPNNLVLQDYYSWEKEFVNQSNAVNYTDIKHGQSEFVFYCNDFQLLTRRTNRH